MESSVTGGGILHDQHGIRLPTEDQARPNVLRRSTGNPWGIPHKQPGIQRPRRSLLLRYGIVRPCGRIQRDPKPRQIYCNSAWDPVPEGGLGAHQHPKQIPCDPGQGAAVGAESGGSRSQGRSQGRSRGRSHPAWDPVAGAHSPEGAGTQAAPLPPGVGSGGRSESRSAAIHPGSDAVARAAAERGQAAAGPWPDPAVPAGPRGSGAARVPAPGAHLLLQLLHLLLVGQLRLLQHPPLRRLLL